MIGWLAFVMVPAPLPEISRARFLDEIRDGHVHSITIVDGNEIRASSTTLGPFWTPYDRVRDARLVDDLRAMNVEVLFERSGGLLF